MFRLEKRLTAVVATVALMTSLAMSIPAAGRPRTSRTAACAGVTLTPTSSLQSSFSANPAGTTFCLSPGTYRPTTTLNLKAGQRLIGAGDPGSVVISGARVVQATREAGRWVITGQRTLGTSRLSGTTSQCRPVDGRDPKGLCVQADQVFLDGVSLWQVGSLAELSPGEFYRYPSTGKLYLVDDPTGRTLEVSVVGTKAIVGGTGVVIENLVVEKFGNSVQSGAVNASRDWTIVDSVFRLNHGAGVHVGPGTVLRGTRIVYNGQLGIHGGQPYCAAARGIVVEGNEIAFNNAAGYNWGWEGGATKWTNTVGLVVRNNDVHDNYGMGLWTDGANIQTLYEGNRVVDNAGMGIDHELGQSAVIANNEVRGNGFAHSMQGDAWGAGIFIDQSRDVEVYGNVVENNAAGIVAVQEPAPAFCGYPEAEVVNLYIHDNLIRQSTGIATGLRLLNEPDKTYYDPPKNNRWQNNAYELGDPAAGLHFKWRGCTVNGVWRDAYTAQEWLAFGHDAAGTLGPFQGRAR